MRIILPLWMPATEDAADAEGHVRRWKISMEARMLKEREISRRGFLAGLAALAATSRGSVTAAGLTEVPIVKKRVEKLYKVDGCREPNDLQFVPDGLWVLDQVDPNKAFKVRPDDGSIVQTVQTESIHGSGITYGNGALWIA